MGGRVGYGFRGPGSTGWGLLSQNAFLLLNCLSFPSSFRLILPRMRFSIAPKESIGIHFSLALMSRLRVSILVRMVTRDSLGVTISVRASTVYRAFIKVPLTGLFRTATLSISVVVRDPVTNSYGFVTMRPPVLSSS